MTGLQPRSAAAAAAKHNAQHQGWEECPAPASPAVHEQIERTWQIDPSAGTIGGMYCPQPPAHAPGCSSGTSPVPEVVALVPGSWDVAGSELAGAPGSPKESPSIPTVVGSWVLEASPANIPPVVEAGSAVDDSKAPSVLELNVGGTEVLLLDSGGAACGVEPGLAAMEVTGDWLGAPDWPAVVAVHTAS